MNRTKINRLKESKMTDKIAPNAVTVPAYRSHKIVGALQIEKVTESANDVLIQFKDGRYSDFYAAVGWAEIHNPVEGAYMVWYKDGYTSLSPKHAFVEGYSALNYSFGTVNQVIEEANGEQFPDVERFNGITGESEGAVVDVDLSDDTVVEVQESDKPYSPSPIMEFFAYGHLPAHLKAVSAPICHMAKLLDQELPAGAEKATALRKLLEAKDAAVRAAV